MGLYMGTYFVTALAYTCGHLHRVNWASIPADRPVIVKVEMACQACRGLHTMKTDPSVYRPVEWRQERE